MLYYWLKPRDYTKVPQPVIAKTYVTTKLAVVATARLNCSNANSRGLLVAPAAALRIPGHAQVVEDEADVTVQSADRGGDAVAGGGLDHAEGETP